MKVPFLDLKANYKSIENEIREQFDWVLENTAYVMGKPVFEFEKAFSKIHNVKHCIATNTGTAGNHLALWALGIGHGDEVIIPANTFIATAWGATLCGATPVFVDCESDSYNLDPQLIENAITKKTKAIVVVHLYGQPANINAIKNIAKKHKLYFVEDAAQAHLAEYKGQKISGLSDVASFSFYPGKNLGAYGEGGCVVTNDDELAEKIRMMRDHGAKDKYYHLYYGHNYRMEALQGAVLGVKLNYLEKWTEERRKVAQKYYDLLKNVEEILLPKEMTYAKHVYHLFVIQINSKNTSKTRDELKNYLADQEIASGLHYPVPLHLQKCFSHLGYKKGDMPVSESLAENGLSLPVFPELQDSQIAYVASKIKEFFIN